MSTIERIKELIAESGKTDYVIKKETGLGNSILSDLKAGRAENPSVKTIKVLATYFNVSADYLLCLTDKKQTINSVIPIKCSPTLPFTDDELKIIMENKEGTKYFEQIISKLDTQQKIYVLSWAVGYAQSQGITVKF